jgi:hypothetical protein
MRGNGEGSLRYELGSEVGAISGALMLGAGIAITETIRTFIATSCKQGTYEWLAMSCVTQ